MSCSSPSAYSWTPSDVPSAASITSRAGSESTMRYSSAAGMRLWSAGAEATANALGVAASITPVNSHRSWLEHVPVSTIKYTMAGPVVHAALTAAHMSRLGHTGDTQAFDDVEYGYPRYTGTTRWA